MSIQPSHSDLQRDVGRVEGTLSAVEKRMDRLESTVTEGFEKVEQGLSKIDRRLASIEAKEAERKGAWKVIAIIAGSVSAFVAAAVKYIMG